MCSSDAAAVKQQCGREYGFSDGEKLRVTDLNMLSASDLEGLRSQSSKKSKQTVQSEEH